MTEARALYTYVTSGPDGSDGPHPTLTAALEAVQAYGTVTRTVWVQFLRHAERRGQVRVTDGYLDYRPLERAR